MSQANVDHVREAYAAFNRGDFMAAANACHADVTWIPYLGAVEASIYRGREALVRMWTEISETLGGTLRLEPVELIDAGDLVIAVVEARGTGTTSGAEVHQRWTQLISMRDGLVVRVEPFPDKAAALEAAGLRAER